MDQAFQRDTPVRTTQGQRFDDTYDAIVRSFDRSGILLTEDLLRNTIPNALFENAVLSGWVPDPFHQTTHPEHPCTLGDYTIGKRDAQLFMDVLAEKISFWLFELGLDKDRLYELEVERLRPPAPDPSKDTPATLLLEYRLRQREDNYVGLAKKAAKHCQLCSHEAILAALYRIEKGRNVSQKTLECIAGAMSTSVRKIEWRELRWPKIGRRRSGRKSANKR